MEVRMKNRFFSVLLFCLILPLVNLSESLAEMLPIDNGLSFSVQAIDRPHDRNHEQSQWRYKLPASVLERAGTKRTQAAEPGFQVPLRRGISNNNPGVFNIAAFVDHDAGPDSLLDWNCGDRTYDTPEFNHNGTDYNGSPYPWLDMANDGLVVVAAADGEIVDIHDGEPDEQCSAVPGADAN
jgi:hypothetical protein